jgi:hypothetical protein
VIPFRAQPVAASSHGLPLYGLLESLYERVKGAWEERFERSPEKEVPIHRRHPVLPPEVEPRTPEEGSLVVLLGALPTPPLPGGIPCSPLWESLGDPLSDPKDLACLTT